MTERKTQAPGFFVMGAPLLLTALFAALTALGAFLRVPVPVLHSSFTLQVFFTCMAGQSLKEKML